VSISTLTANPAAPAEAADPASRSYEPCHKIASSVDPPDRSHSQVNTTDPHHRLATNTGTNATHRVRIPADAA
jgi:hypothetical protein